MPTATLTSVFFNLVDFTEDTSFPPPLLKFPLHIPLFKITLFSILPWGKLLKNLKLWKWSGKIPKTFLCNFRHGVVNYASVFVTVSHQVWSILVWDLWSRLEPAQLYILALLLALLAIFHYLTNTLAYSIKALITTVKFFIVKVSNICSIMH